MSKKFFYTALLLTLIILIHYGLNIKIIAKLNFLNIKYSSINISVRYDANDKNEYGSIKKHKFDQSYYFNLTKGFFVEKFNLFIKNKLSSYFITNGHDHSSRNNLKKFNYETSIKTSTDLITKEKKMCPMIPANLVGRIQVNETILSIEEIEQTYSSHKSYENINGHFRPKYCLPHSKVAIIIPYRNRLDHLKVFLNNMHKFLQKQLIEYTIYVIEEVPLLPFNRALLMNIGYSEAIQENDFSCFIFHDVDLLPLDDRNFYFCPIFPRHMSVNINTFDFVLPYKEILGGVTAINRVHFEKNKRF